MIQRLAFFLVLALTCATPRADAQTLLYYFDFNSGVTDSVGGSVTGSLAGGASVSGGAVVFDGSSGQVAFTQKLVPTSGSYSVTFSAKQSIAQTNYMEFISQGSSGGPGFYIGQNPSAGIRVTDSWISTGFPMPSVGQWHYWALTVDATAGNSKLYLDGVLQGTLGLAISTTTGGDVTRLGKQFSPYGEYFNGSMDDLRIFNGALSAAQVSALTSVPEPHEIWLLSAGLGVLLLKSRRRLLPRQC